MEHFRGAGCAEADIRGALKNHYCRDQLDLGPEPEPEKVRQETCLKTLSSLPPVV